MPTFSDPFSYTGTPVTLEEPGYFSAVGIHWSFAGASGTEPLITSTGGFVKAPVTFDTCFSFADPTPDVVTSFIGSAEVDCNVPFGTDAAVGWEVSLSSVADFGTQVVTATLQYNYGGPGTGQQCRIVLAIGFSSEVSPDFTMGPGDWVNLKFAIDDTNANAYKDGALVATIPYCGYTLGYGRIVLSTTGTDGSSFASTNTDGGLRGFKLRNFSWTYDTVGTPVTGCGETLPPCPGGQRPLSTLFADALSGECLTLACCLKLTRSDGLIYGFTTLDTDLVIDGVTYEAQDGLGLSNLRTKAGTGIDNFDLTGLQTENRVVADDLRGGRYDGARISLFAVDYEDLAGGTMVLLTGNIGQVTHSDGGFQFEARSLTQRLAQQVGDLYCPLCRVHQLGDAQCKVDLSLYTFDRTVVGTPDRRNIFFGSDTHASGYYDYGLVFFIDGLNSGISRPIKSHSLTGGGAAIILQEPFPYNVAAGDQATLQAGCDRTTTICKSRFNNIINLRAEPMVPRSDTTIQVQRTA